jgi:hypothetical protein
VSAACPICHQPGDDPEHLEKWHSAGEGRIEVALSDEEVDALFGRSFWPLGEPSLMADDRFGSNATISPASDFDRLLLRMRTSRRAALISMVD